MTLKHYVIGGHGRLDVSYDVSQYTPIGADTLAIPQGLHIVMYIPPGTIFSARSGINIQTRILNAGGLDDYSALDKFLTGLKGELKSKKKDYSAKGTFYAYDESAFAGKYPRRWKTGDSHQVYDYKIQGAGKNDQIQGMLWGAYHRSSKGPIALHKLAAGEHAKLSELLTKIAKDAGGEAIVHCIFCRVEVLDKKAKKNLIYKTTELSYVKFKSK